MNIRKEIDYGTMYTALDGLMAQDLPQMELCCGMGRIVCCRAEKGAAVAAAEYLQAKYPEASGFSPRSLRRMRDFYRTYENSPALLDEAMEIGWTQNIVILEAGLTLEEMGWYIRAVRRYGWTKKQLVDGISAQEHLSQFDKLPSPCYTESVNEATENERYDEDTVYLPREYLPQPHGGVCDEGSGAESGVGEEIPDSLRCHQHRGDWQPGLSPCTAQAGGARNIVRRTQCPATDQWGLRPVRSAHWHGSGEPPEYVPYLRRGLCRQNAPPDGVCQAPKGAPNKVKYFVGKRRSKGAVGVFATGGNGEKRTLLRRSGRPVVHGRLRGNLAGCAGGLPRAA